MKIIPLSMNIRFVRKKNVASVTEKRVLLVSHIQFVDNMTHFFQTSVY